MIIERQASSKWTRLGRRLVRSKLQSPRSNAHIPTKGSGFRTFALPQPIGALSLGICMDLNPFTDEWSYEDGPFEIASYCKIVTPTKPQTRVLVILCAWLDGLEDDSAEYNTSVLNYWMMRLKPLWSNEDSRLDSDADQMDTVGDPDETEEALTASSDNEGTIVIVCNRCGEENGKTIAC